MDEAPPSSNGQGPLPEAAGLVIYAGDEEETSHFWSVLGTSTRLLMGPLNGKMATGLSWLPSFARTCSLEPQSVSVGRPGTLGYSPGLVAVWARCLEW